MGPDTLHTRVSHLAACYRDAVTFLFPSLTSPSCVTYVTARWTDSNTHATFSTRLVLEARFLLERFQFGIAKLSPESHRCCLSDNLRSCFSCNYRSSVCLTFVHDNLISNDNTVVCFQTNSQKYTTADVANWEKTISVAKWLKCINVASKKLQYNTLHTLSC